jgi:hypothetical protein
VNFKDPPSSKLGEDIHVKEQNLPQINHNNLTSNSIECIHYIINKMYVEEVLIYNTFLGW